MKFFVLIATIALQSCTPVFAQNPASQGTPNTAESPTKNREPADKKKKKKTEVEKKLESSEYKDPDKIGTTDTEKAEFEKKPNEPNTLDKTYDEVVEIGSETSQKVGRTLGAARSRRAETTWSFLGQYSIFEMWTLTKYGATIGYNKSASTTYEFEYSRGSLGFGYFGVDLGRLSEERFGINWRTYGQRNAFSFVTGLYYNKLGIHFGNDLLAKVPGFERTRVDLLELDTVGLKWGIGSRWQSRGGFVWGADWLSINIPFWTVRQKHPFIDATTSEADREKTQDAINVLRRVPEIAALNVKLGFTF